MMNLMIQLMRKRMHCSKQMLIMFDLQYSVRCQNELIKLGPCYLPPPSSQPMLDSRGVSTPQKKRFWGVAKVI